MSLTLDPALLVTLKGGAALLFASAALHKARDLHAFRDALAGHALLPRAVLPAAAVCFIAAEAALAGAWLSPQTRAPVATVSIALMGLYTAAVALNLLRGRRSIDCGCGAPSGRQTLSWGLVARNVALIGMFACAGAAAGTRALVWLDGFTVAFGLAVLALLYLVADNLLAIASSSDDAAHEPSRERRWSTP